MIRLPAIPIIYRELLTAARSPLSRRIRLIMGSTAVIGSILAIVLMDTFSAGGAAGGGKTILTRVAATAYLYCIAVGFSLTLTCISEEREQGTLSLLFLTDLRGGEIVIAKLFTRLLRTLEGLIAAMPLIATCILLGGVTPGEYGRVALALVNALFVSATLGMYISSQRLQRTAAAFLGGALALAIGLLVPFLGIVLTQGYKMPELGRAISAFSPCAALEFSLADPAGGVPPEYYQTLCSSFLTGLLFLAMAIRSVRGNWQDRPNEVQKIRRRKDFQNWDFKSASRDPDYRRRLLDLNPICWLNSRDRFRSIGYWIFLGVVYFTLALCWWFLDRRGSPLGYWWLATLIFDFGIRAKLNQAAGIQLVEERKQGSLEMLMCAPLGLPKILKGFFLALRRQFAPMLLAALGLNLLILLFTLLRHSQMQRRSLPDAGFIILIVACYLIAAASSYRALAWVGMWNGLRNKPGAALSGFGLTRILARPILLIFLTFLALVFYELAGGQPWSKFTIEMLVVYGAVVFLVSDHLYVRQARAAIPAAFQFAATGVVDEEPAADKPTAKPRTKKQDKLIARLWSQTWIRWTAPVLALAMILAGYRWNLSREYGNRLEALRAGGSPISTADINSNIARNKTALSSSLILNAYRLTSGVFTNAQISAAMHQIDRYNSATVGADNAAALRDFIEKNDALFRVFDEAVDHGSFDLQFTQGLAWPYYKQVRIHSSLLHLRILLAIYEDRVPDAIVLMKRANRHQELLEEATLFGCHAVRIYHLDRHNKALAHLLSTRDPTREQLLDLQRQAERLLEGTPAFYSSQLEGINAFQIEAFSLPAEELFHASLPPWLLPPRVPPKLRLQFQAGRLLGSVDKARLLRLDCAQIAREIALQPSAQSITKIKKLQASANESMFLRNTVRPLEVYAATSLRNTLDLRVAITALAIERYRMDHNGELPRTVDTLFPLYIKDVPINPFTNQPLLIYPNEQHYQLSGDRGAQFSYSSSAMRIPNTTMRINK